MFPGEHVDNVYLPWIFVVRIKDIFHSLLERLTEEGIVHEDDGAIIRDFPVNDAGSDGLDHPSALPVTETLDIAARLHGEFTIDLDANDSLVSKHPCNQQRFTLA